METPNDADLCTLFVKSLEDYAVLFLDPSRRVLFWNRGAELLLGYSAEEMIGRRPDVIFTPEDIATRTPEKEAAEAAASGKAMDDRWHIRKDGSRFWAAGVMVRLDGPNGEVRGLAKLLRDQTALKLAQEGRGQAEEALLASERRFRRLIEANIIGVGILGRSGAWVEANDELLRIVDRSRADLRAGQVRWDQMTPPEFAPLDEKGMAEADERGACSGYEKEILRKDGTRVPVFIGYATVSGVEGHYIAFVLDLSPQKRVEQALREADQRKDEFLAMLAHELRNPLAPLLTGLELISLPGADPATVRRVREMMARQVGAMTRLVDDLLDVSRIMRGKVELRVEPTDVQSVVRQAVETSQPLIDARGHELIVSLPAKPIPVVGDPVRLAQVVTNLLNNAAKYTEPGGRISLTAAREGQAAVVSVRDTGVGIPPEWLPQVFDLFTQVDPTLARSQGGLGIGLTLVRRLVEMHGGTVSARSEGRGAGSEFTVRLPVDESADREAPSPAQAPSVGRPLDILIVDDNTDAAEAMGMLVEILGHRPQVVHTGAAALERVADRPDVVLLDIGLPEVSGYEVAQEIRRRFSGNGPLVAAVSGYGSEEDRRRSKEAGFDHHLVKPVNASQLQKLLAARNGAG